MPKTRKLWKERHANDVKEHRETSGPVPPTHGNIPLCRPERFGKRTAEHIVREFGVNPFKMRYDE